MKYVFSGCEHADAAALVEAYHYSGRMPGNIQNIFCLREPGGLFGDFGFKVFAACIFSIPPTRWREPVLELSRLVRDPEFEGPLSALISQSCRVLRASEYPLVVSFADWTQKHHGGIYQASGWNYAGCRDRQMDGIVIDGEFKPGRSCNSAWGTRSPDKLAAMFPDKDIAPHFDEGKHLYYRALRIAGKSQARRLGLFPKQYPKPDNAACPLDELGPTSVSRVQPPEAAPNIPRGPA